MDVCIKISMVHSVWYINNTISHSASHLLRFCTFHYIKQDGKVLSRVLNVMICCFFMMCYINKSNYYNWTKLAITKSIIMVNCSQSVYSTTCGWVGLSMLINYVLAHLTRGLGCIIVPEALGGKGGTPFSDRCLISFARVLLTFSLIFPVYFTFTVVAISLRVKLLDHD